MKKYKVGDTIYIKDTVIDIDYGDLTATYYSDHNGWLDNSCIIDELPAEPVKPVLPKKVADELEITKKLNFSFDNYIARVIVYDKPSYTNSHAFWMNNGDGVIKTLMDVWFNGYTVEEEKYNLVLGTNGSNKYTCSTIAKETSMEGNIFLFINPVTIPNDLTVPQYQFTQSEIDKYNNDFWIKGIDLNDYKVEVKE